MVTDPCLIERVYNLLILQITFITTRVKLRARYDIHKLGVGRAADVGLDGLFSKGCLWVLSKREFDV